MLALGLVDVVPKSTVAFILNFFGLRVRCTSSYFCGAKDAPWVLAYLRQISCAAFSVRQLPSVDSPYASRWTSSTNPPTCSRKLVAEHSSINGALKKRNNTGEIGDPCGIPVSAEAMRLVFFPRVIDVALSVKKLAVHFTIAAGIRFSLRLWSSL